MPGQVITTNTTNTTTTTQTTTLCKRCNTLEAALTVRNDALCRDCFTNYVHTKIVKRMEAFRTRHSAHGEEPLLLLPISLGLSSLTLLQILHRHRQSQRHRTGRTGFNLRLFNVAMPGSDSVLEGKKLDAVRRAYPHYSLTTLPLDTVFLPSSCHDSLSRNEKGAAQKALARLLESTPSATSASHVLSLLRTRLIVAFATSNTCEGILWGSSTTKLAETILAETAKGHGFSLPWAVTDGLSPYGLPFFYPVRDVLKKELISRLQLDENAALKEMVIQEGVTKAPPSSKNTSIDALVKQYFESVEEHYPSIISNVVRTTGKLEQARWNGAQRCKLCQLPVDEALLGINAWGGHQETHQEAGQRDAGLCYGCTRSLPTDAIPFLP
ncbi:hypothetical protein FKW77_000574 [Venturia effusa]|uniref:Cytoplasmic tRNA 2-thiolation protein 2 n=1 Tax=Venturia effusa TaxID=50376 RepID=A0A517LN71_9PEZI|nr:hypothetical protein FKW77_000574 [Venturia effusa]